MNRLFTLSIALFALMLCSFSAMAQDEMTDRAVSYGIKAGVGLANFSGDDKDFVNEADEIIEPDAKLGINFGFWLKYALSPQVAIQPEVLYVAKGAKYEDGEFEENVKLNYIEVPILFKFMIPTEGTVDPNIFVGPAVAFKASAKDKIEGPGVDIEEDIDDIKSIDFGATFGVGVDVAMGNGTLTFDGRYTLGLTDWPDIEGVDVAIKNTNISFFIGYGI